MAIKLKAVKRENLSRAKTKQLRSSGQVPAVVYGKDKESKSVAVDSLTLLKTVRDEGRNAIITLEIENDAAVDVMLHEYQMDAIKNDLVHVDFYIVDMAEEMEVSVPVRIEGEAAGVKDGGVMQQPLFELLIKVKPGDIPEEISIDVSELVIGDVIAISDLPQSDKFEYIEEADTAVVTIVAPSSEEPETDVDENAEPELVGGDDKETEE